MVTRSKSYVHSWHFVIIVRPIRQEIVHHARTYGGRVKGNESPSSLGSLAFPAMLSVYTPSVFPSFPRLETVNSSRANIFHRFLRSHWKRSIFVLQCTNVQRSMYTQQSYECEQICVICCQFCRIYFSVFLYLRKTIRTYSGSRIYSNACWQLFSIRLKFWNSITYIGKVWNKSENVHRSGDIFSASIFFAEIAKPFKRSSFVIIIRLTDIIMKVV